VWPPELQHILDAVNPEDRIPDVRDGLTRLQRVILFVLHETQAEREGANVPTAMLYGRVCERISVSQGEFMRTMQRLMGR
jgi:hypothetical protein